MTVGSFIFGFDRFEGKCDKESSNAYLHLLDWRCNALLDERQYVCTLQS